MRIPPFRIERYYDRYEFSARYMLSSSDAESRSVAELLALEPGAERRLHELRLGYTEARGAPALRAQVARVYDTLEPSDTLVCSSAEEGIFLLYHSLLGPGDHAVVETPCYQSALELARSTGAEVSTWSRRFEDGWAHDLDALERLLRPNTRVVYINAPHNPTGLLMRRPVFDAVLALGLERGFTVFSDEVYRELEHDPAERLPAACDVSETAVSLGTVSKTYGLPGLRLGWLASRDRDTLARALDLKHYTTICSSAPSELLTEVALKHRETLAARNLAIVHHNLPQLTAFLERHQDTFTWVPPQAGPIGFVRLGTGEDVDAFCRRVVEDADVLLLPGSVYDQPGFLRVAYGRADMPDALSVLEGYLRGG
ncbi:MAG TPA: aminotransferase class I/II-fold pyridoxal phosphate-dependent enzyme [Trueperaceae bacterium]|nr:aminotransferase class I/II-fold pyridoxal phosphate-dependent enzyme [Trueperaceae bacterium]